MCSQIYGHATIPACLANKRPAASSAGTIPSDYSIPQMAKFKIPVEKLKERGVNTGELIQLLELIHAPPGCMGLRSVIPLLLHSANAFARLAPNIPAISDLVALLDRINQHLDLLEGHVEPQGMNVMFGHKIEDYPVYSLFSQGKTIGELVGFAPRFHLVTGILLATIWLSKEPWHPIPRGYASFVANLRKARSHRQYVALSKVNSNVISLPELINSLGSAPHKNSLSNKIRELAIKLQDVLVELEYRNISSNPLGMTSQPWISELQDNEVPVLSQSDILVPVHTEPTQSPRLNSSPSDAVQPVGEQNSGARKKPSARPVRNLFQKEISNPNANTVALAPAMLQAVPQADTPADQPVKPAAIQSLEVLYTNYRTAMDNQRLPWVWDCINKFEIAAIRNILIVNSMLKNATIAEKQGSFLVWLLLATGQTIEQILKFALCDSQDTYGALLTGPIYRRYIHPLPHAFHPNGEQELLLSSHATFVDLQLLPPYPILINELDLNNSKVEILNRHHDIGSFLELDAKAADITVRQFLAKHRTRDMRLLPGRIRNVLGAEIMRASKDPVITHLLSALPTDMPPSGVYYTAYTKEVMERVYREAATRIFGNKD